MQNETTEGFEVYPLEETVVKLATIKTSIKEFGDAHGLDYLEAQGFIKAMVKLGHAKQLESRKVAGQKGKPTNIYELPASFTMKLVA